MDAAEPFVDPVPVVAVPGRSHPLLLQALGMPVPSGPTQAVGAAFVDDTLPVIENKRHTVIIVSVSTATLMRVGTLTGHRQWCMW